MIADRRRQRRRGKALMMCDDRGCFSGFALCCDRCVDLSKKHSLPAGAQVKLPKRIPDAGGTTAMESWTLVE